MLHVADYVRPDGRLEMIPASSAEVHRRLCEWARWLRPGAGAERNGRCASLEGRYQQPRRDGSIIVCDECNKVTKITIQTECPYCACPFPPFDEPEPPGVPVNLAEVLEVERVIGKLPRKNAMHLRLWYFERRDEFAIRRRIAVPTLQLPEHLEASRRMVANALARAAASAHYSTRPVNPTLPCDLSQGAA